jgi:hypothetical protein
MESNSNSDKGGYKKRLAQDKDISEEVGDDGSSESESSENGSENDDSYGSSAHDNEGKARFHGLLSNILMHQD